VTDLITHRYYAHISQGTYSPEHDQPSTTGSGGASPNGPEKTGAPTLSLVSICGLCGSPCARPEWVIKDAPASTFNCLDETIDLPIVECEECGAVQLHESVPLSTDWNVYRNSIGISGQYRAEKEGRYLIAKLRFGQDLIIESYTLEHHPRPTQFMAELISRMEPQQCCLIEVPNYDHIEKNSIWMEFTRDHRFYYRSRTLSLLLLQSGFEIVEMKEEAGGLCLATVVRKPARKSLSVMKEKMEEDVEAFHWHVLNKGPYSVYGAGHYTQLLLSHTSFKPAHIYDSNPAKVGQKICGVTVELGCSDLDDKNLIVICGVYNDEVLAMLKAWGKKGVAWS
jgi:hypothetical protein